MSFEKLNSLNVNDKTEKKNNLSYLSWAWAWSEFVKIYPTATYEIVKNENGMPYFRDDSGAFCYTKVKANDITHEMWLPVMDYKNQAIKNPNAFEVNKTVMRCLTKNLAMFGLGLYIYAGEDLPESEETKPTGKKPNELWGEFVSYFKDANEAKAMLAWCGATESKAMESAVKKFLFDTETLIDQIDVYRNK